MRQIHFQIGNKLLIGLLLLLMSFGGYAQTTVVVPAACNTCSTPCTPPTTLVCDAAAATISAGGTLTSSVTGGTGGSITWTIAPTAGVSTASGSGTTTGAVTFATAGTYTLTFTSTNNATPAACSPAASVTCTRTITVNPAPTLAFNCSGAALTPVSYRRSVAYTGKVAIPYTGGNNEIYGAGSVASVGVTGFTATWPAGALSTGSDSVTISITGSTTATGNALFPITIAGQSCTITLGTCGAFIATNVWKEFLCHNLGANTNLNPHVPDVGLLGAYIQWGKRGPNTTDDSRIDWQTAANNGGLGFVAPPTTSNPNIGPITGWNQMPSGNNAWLSTTGTKTTSDPCPTGYRVPTTGEWSGVANNNVATLTGTFVASNTEYGSIVSFGPNASTKSLSLPAAGHYDEYGDSLRDRGYRAGYWTSEPTALSSFLATKYEFLKLYGSFYQQASSEARNAALPVRCIAQ